MDLPKSFWILYYLRLFLKSDWSLEDYPIRYREQSGNWVDGTPLVPWIAQIDRWPQMQGHGNTREEALKNLCDSFSSFKSERQLPRPGTAAPLVFASSRLIAAYDAIARDFFPKILGIDYDDCFVSDESSLHDFEPVTSYSGALIAIKANYGIEVPDAAKGNLVDIFELIRTSRGRQ
jgi:hypothetical protein